MFWAYENAQICVFVNFKSQRKMQRKRVDLAWLTQIISEESRVQKIMWCFIRNNAFIFIFLAIKRKELCFMSVLKRTRDKSSVLDPAMIQVIWKCKFPSVLSFLTIMDQDRKLKNYVRSCKYCWWWNIRICMLGLVVRRFWMCFKGKASSYLNIILWEKNALPFSTEITRD